MTYTSLKTALLDYVTDGWQNAWDKHYRTYREQARALFTSYCIMLDIYTDTATCDMLMLELYEHIPFDADDDVDYDDFYNYMVELIV